MDPKRSEPTDETKLRPIREIVSEIFDLIKPRFELDGKKFILVVFDRDEFIKASTKLVGNYGIDAAAGCGRSSSCALAAENPILGTWKLQSLVFEAIATGPFGSPC